MSDAFDILIQQINELVETYEQPTLPGLEEEYHGDVPPDYNEHPEAYDPI